MLIDDRLGRDCVTIPCVIEKVLSNTLNKREYEKRHCKSNNILYCDTPLLYHFITLYKNTCNITLISEYKRVLHWHVVFGDTLNLTWSQNESNVHEFKGRSWESYTI